MNQEVEDQKIWGFIYCYDIQEKKYIGQVAQLPSTGLRKRFRAHFKIKTYNTYFHNSLRKYFKPGDFRIIETHFGTKHEVRNILNTREIFWISELNTYDPKQKKGWNLQQGGRVPKERIKIKDIKRKLSSDHKDKISASLKGRKKTELEIQHIKEALTGQPKTEEHKQHLSDNHADFRGNKNPWYGKGHLQLGEKNPNAKAVILISPDKKEYILPCFFPFCRERGLNPFCISLVLKGKQKHHKGWTGRFLKK